MIAFDTPRREQEFRLNSARDSGVNFTSTDRVCHKCGAKRRQSELLVASLPPYSRYHPKLFACKGGCDVAH